MKTLNKQFVSATSLGVALLLSLSATADEKRFKGNGEFGYSKASGNTESSSLFGALNFSYSREQDEIVSKIEANQQSEDSQTTQERYLLDLQYNRFYTTEKDYYSFIGARFEQNKFEGIDLDSTYNLGLGKKLYQTSEMKLKGEIGLGYQTIDYTTEAGGDSDSQAIARGKLDYQYTINANVDFAQDLLVTAGSNQTKFEANTAVKVKLAEQMRLKAGFKYRHNTDPAESAEKTDTQTLLTLVYDF